MSHLEFSRWLLERSNIVCDKGRDSAGQKKNLPAKFMLFPLDKYIGEIRFGHF